MNGHGVLTRGEDVARRTVGLGRRGRALMQISRWEAAPGPASAAAFAAVRAALAPGREESEATWVQRIESVRTGLGASVRTLAFEDFGAGPDDAATGTGPSWQESTVGAVTRRTSARPRWGRLLFHLARELRPDVALELGTSVGISAGYLGAGLEVGAGGRLVTLEGGSAVADQARSTLTDLGLTDRVEVVVGAFADTLPGVLERCGRSLDLAFIDGHHRRDATLAYLEQILPHLSDTAVLVFDDIHWSSGMEAAWDQIAGDPRFALTVDLGGLGLVTVEPGGGGRAPRQERVRYA